MRSRTLLAIALLLGALLGAVPPRPMPVAALSCGPCPATSTDHLNLRDGPSLEADVLRVIPAGAELEWDPLREQANGFIPVVYDGTAGWSHGAYLILFPTTATTTARLNLRTGPSLDEDIRLVMPAGSDVQVTSGPDNGFYSVRFDQQIPGWAHGDYLDFARQAAFGPGDEAFVATDALNFRAAPGLGAEILTVLTEGNLLFIEEGPIFADGYAWFKGDRPGSPGSGWVAGDYLSHA